MVEVECAEDYTEICISDAVDNVDIIELDIFQNLFEKLFEQMKNKMRHYFI